MIKRLSISTLVISLFVIACSQMGSSDRPISPDEKVFRAQCRTCHRLPSPDKMTDEDWQTFLPSHAERAKISPSNKQAILRHLQARN